MALIFVVLLILALALYWRVTTLRPAADDRQELLIIGVLGGLALALAFWQAAADWNTLPSPYKPVVVHLGPSAQSFVAAAGMPEDVIADALESVDRQTVIALITANSDAIATNTKDIAAINDKLNTPPIKTLDNPVLPETCPTAPATAATLTSLQVKQAGVARRIYPILPPNGVAKIASADISYCPLGHDEASCIPGTVTPGCTSNFICGGVGGNFATIPDSVAADKKFCVRLALAFQNGSTGIVIGGPVMLSVGQTWPAGAVPPPPPRPVRVRKPAGRQR